MIKSFVSARLMGCRYGRPFTCRQVFEIVNPTEVWLTLKVPARYATLASAAEAAVFRVEGSERRYRTGRKHRRQHD